MTKVETPQFTGLIAEYQEDNSYDFFDYNRLTPQDIGGDEYYQGRPVLSEVSEQTFENDDGTKRTTYRCQLFLVDDDAEEFLQININLKQAGDIQKNLHHKSMAYKLIAGIMETIQKGWSQDHNFITQTNLKEFRDYINKLNSMTIFIREETGTDNTGREFVYYPFKITEVQ